MVALSILVILNLIFAFQVLHFSAKITKDIKFTEWQKRHKCTYLFVTISSALVSFKFNRINSSYFLGRRSFLIEFSDERPYFKLSQSLGIVYILLGNAPIILIDSAALMYF